MAEIHDFPTSDAIRQASERLKSGGGGGTSDGMEQRIGRLETKMDGVEGRLTSIEVALARIEAKLDSKVDYKWLTIYVLGIVAVIMRNEIASLFVAG
jgi:flavin reductase (DIM6/NTAB) family NADH-FMN oxidoreductase RutF